MRVSLNWLTDYVDVSISARDLAGLLSAIGFNCEEIIETPDDVVLDLEVTTNRPDLLGHLGVAREIAAATGADFRPPEIGPLPTSGSVKDLTAVEVLDAKGCPRYTARVIRGVKVGQSPEWLRRRLEAIGQRCVNNIVDVTNYVLFEYSQPLHAFDYDKLADHRIVVRRAAGGEQMVSIDGTRCRLSEDMLVIADARKPVAIAGIMGGLDTEVTEKTVDVLIESAQFDPLSIRVTSRKLALMSESNYRFERGVDPVAVERASLRACQLILQTAGGQLADGVADAWAQPFEPRVVALRPQRCSQVLGLDVAAERQFRILQRLGLSPSMHEGRIVCAIPSHRADLQREADLIEEIARLEGYDKIPVGRHVTHTVVAEGLPARSRKELASVLTAAGLDETVTFAFIDQEEAELFGCPEGVRLDPVVRKTNNILRMSLLPSLLRACKTNQDAGAGDVNFFELGAVFPPGGGAEAMPREYVQLGMVSTGELSLLQGALEAAVGRLAPQCRLEVREGSFAGFAAGCAGEVLLDGKPFGQIGLVSRQVQDFYGLARTVAAAAVNFDMLLEQAGRRRRYSPLARFPSVERDLSLIVEEGVSWQRIAQAVEAAREPTLASAEHVTTYRGKPIPPGRKSVTIRLTCRCADRTLRSEEVDELVGRLAAAMKEKLQAEIRA